MADKFNSNQGQNRNKQQISKNQKKQDLTDREKLKGNRRDSNLTK